MKNAGQDHNLAKILEKKFRLFSGGKWVRNHKFRGCS